MPCDGDAGRGERGRAAPHVLERRVDAGADDADGAEVVVDADAVAEPCGQIASRTRASSCRFSRETTSVSRSSPTGAAACRRRWCSSSSARHARVEPAAVDRRRAAPARRARWRRRRRCPACAAGARRTTVPSADGSAPGQRRRASRARRSRCPFSLANSTACAFSTFAPDSASSCVSSYDSVPMRVALRHDARVGGVDAVDVGADLAVLGAERRGHRDRGRVAAAAAERRDLAPVGHALIAGDDDDLAARELVLDAERPHLDDARVDVAIVGDDARLAAGEADRVAAELADRHRQQRHRDPLAGGEQHVELAPVRDSATPAWPAPSSSSVVSPIAETTTTTSCPARRVRMTRSATCCMRVDVRDARAAVLLDDDGHQDFRGSNTATSVAQAFRPAMAIAAEVLATSILQARLRERRDDRRVVARADLLLHRTRGRPRGERVAGEARSRAASRCCAARMLRHGAHQVNRPSLSGSSARPTSTRPRPMMRSSSARSSGSWPIARGLRSFGCTSRSVRATFRSPHSTSVPPGALKRRGVGVQRLEEPHLGGEVLAAVRHVDRRDGQVADRRRSTMRFS